MRGFGSTRWAGTDTKDTVEAYLSLDIGELSNMGCFQPGFRGIWEWSCEGKLVTSIRLSYQADQLTLRYAYGARDGRWTEYRTAHPDRLDLVSLRGVPPVFLVS